MPVHENSCERPLITSSTNQEFTPIGPYLRRWKLDELPQIFNVLGGEMSLVGPRPKLREHQSSCLVCRPGITGFATLIFASEESIFSGLSDKRLRDVHHRIVLPLKEQLDHEYLLRATFASDLQLILKSIFRIWDVCEARDILRERIGWGSELVF
jgi:lipopolysaccharide/colanic/teichoic acid biosynthesis glycosyltransferase